MKKISLMVSMVLLSIYAVSNYAETCPSVASLKKDNLTGWKFYDSEDGTPLTPKKIKEFKTMAQKFVLAEWQSKPAAIHCYYSDASGAGAEAYIAKEHFKPIKSENWYQVTGATHCYASMQKCQFMTDAKHLARSS